MRRLVSILVLPISLIKNSKVPATRTSSLTLVSISDDKIAACCAELSRKFVCCVRIEKLHEEYGNANVFNGGSDYEVVCADRFACECLNGKEISRVKEVF